jgi:N-methylhydantoinase A
LHERFAAEHKKLYGYNLPGQAVEALHWRLTALVRTQRPARLGPATAMAGKKIRAEKKRPVIFDGRAIVSGVYEGQRLGAHASLKGPAIVEEPTTTIVVPPGWQLAVNRFGDYEMKRGKESARSARHEPRRTRRKENRIQSE